MPIIKNERYREFLKLVRDRLPEKKVSHCVFVAEYLSSFAPGLGVDHDQAVAAGLLHDICRKLPDDEMLHRARRYGLCLTEVQLERPVLLHGPVAAEEVRRELGLDDAALYEAIYWHTTGRPGLGILGQALYVADFAEPSRTYPEAAQTREILRKEGFRRALLYAADSKLHYVRQRPNLDPDGEAFFLWLRKEFA